ncbi:hypothetical protein JHW43_009292 [Diplocarpon mali]|nr:hypothetical protein JHW43_009292 [Diplocarpon mali]
MHKTRLFRGDRSMKYDECHLCGGGPWLLHGLSKTDWAFLQPISASALYSVRVKWHSDGGGFAAPKQHWASKAAMLGELECSAVSPQSAEARDPAWKKCEWPRRFPAQAQGDPGVAGKAGKGGRERWSIVRYSTEYEGCR